MLPYDYTNTFVKLLNPSEEEFKLQESLLNELESKSKFIDITMLSVLTIDLAINAINLYYKNVKNYTEFDHILLEICNLLKTNNFIPIIKHQEFLDTFIKKYTYIPNTTNNEIITDNIHYLTAFIIRETLNIVISKNPIHFIIASIYLPELTSNISLLKNKTDAFNTYIKSLKKQIKNLDK